MQNYQIKQINYPSINGIDTIVATIYVPNDMPKGIIQISHGMCEYIGRYAKFMEYMANNGYIIAGNDHLGHGLSSKREDYGFFGSNNGYLNFIEDLHSLTKILKAEYGNELNYYLFGHSMGSFIARLYLSKYQAELSGAIICGTGGPNPMAYLGIIASMLSKQFKGERYRSQLLDKMAFGSLNKNIQDLRTDKDWLTRDEAIVDKYLQDPKCMFTFTAAGFKDLMRLSTKANNRHWFKSIDKQLPIYLIAGDDDPVGNYGKGVTKVYNQLLKNKVSDVELKLYPKARHEILNEINNSEVFQDILKWLNDKNKKTI